MRWILKTGNIVNEPADVLICSANPHLTLSGGVGADLLEKYGLAMQSALEKIIKERTPHFVQQGEIISYSSDALPYRAIFHVVAVNGWYESSPAIIEKTVAQSFQMAAKLNSKKVALTALATGFGHLTLAEFAEGVRPLFKKEINPIEEICICLLEDYRIQELAKYLPEALII